MPTQTCTWTDENGDTHTETQEIPDHSVPADTPPDEPDVQADVNLTADAAAFNAGHEKLATATTTAAKVTALAQIVGAIRV